MRLFSFCLISDIERNSMNHFQKKYDPLSVIHEIEQQVNTTTVEI